MYDGIHVVHILRMAAAMDRLTDLNSQLVDSVINFESVHWRSDFTNIVRVESIVH